MKRINNKIESFSKILSNLIKNTDELKTSLLKSVKKEKFSTLVINIYFNI